ncbi:MAG: hypothetical protein CMJ40_05875 [Phycisphaerae bacterium]|nr:hypothetical protein [Phycisphaerae bacterium]|tara:strand:+ start:411 stop:1058 length:648 start_codon:yes stop_codon:yes gene_type:complete
MAHPRSVLLTVFVLFASLSGCSQASKSLSGQQLRSNIATVEKWMTGTFESSATGDRIVQARIWKFLDDGPWFYSEHSRQGDSGQPIRQRIVRLEIETDGSVAMDMFAIPGNPLEYPAPWQGNGSMGGLQPRVLDPLIGCRIVLQKIDANEFAGETEGDGCPSSRDGATHETTRITLRSNRMMLLSRGFDANGKQVWGSTSGAVTFNRTSRTPPEE